MRRGRPHGSAVTYPRSRAGPSSRGRRGPQRMSAAPRLGGRQGVSPQGSGARSGSHVGTSSRRSDRNAPAAVPARVVVLTKRSVAVPWANWRAHGCTHTSTGRPRRTRARHPARRRDGSVLRWRCGGPRENRSGTADETASWSCAGPDLLTRYARWPLPSALGMKDRVPARVRRRSTLDETNRPS